MFFSLGCASMAPIANFDTSIWTWKITFQSGDLRIGVDVRQALSSCQTSFKLIEGLFALICLDEDSD